MAEQALEQLKKWVEESDNIVFFGGAGVSTESGIPDFRSENGLYRQKYKYPPEQMLSHSFFMSHTEEFFQYYKDQMLVLDVKPNKAHLALARLEAAGKVKAVVTQNIDGLHQAAGSKNVLELHQARYGVNSTVGQGSVFWFALPIVPQEEPPLLPEK